MERPATAWEQNYGAESSGLKRVCGAQPPTADYVTNNLDCCDDAADLELAAQANPDFEVPDWPTLSIPECSKPFDWNCDGEETQRPGGGCEQHTSEAACQDSFTDQTPACGTQGDLRVCIWTIYDECVTGNQGGLDWQRCY